MKAYAKNLEIQNAATALVKQRTGGGRAEPCGCPLTAFHRLWDTNHCSLCYLSGWQKTQGSNTDAPPWSLDSTYLVFQMPQTGMNLQSPSPWLWHGTSPRIARNRLASCSPSCTEKEILLWPVSQRGQSFKGSTCSVPAHCLPRGQGPGLTPASLVFV